MSEASPERHASQEEYAAELATIAAVLRLAHGSTETIDLERIRRELSRAESVGPILDPTAFIRASASKQLEMQAVLIRWVGLTRTAFEEMKRLHEGAERKKLGRR